MKLGIIGGSGLYDIEGLEDVQEISLETPFGDPSDVYIKGSFSGKEVYFLPRHGKGHRLLPSELNHRANIYGFKELGVERILSVSAVGSLRQELRPRDVVLPDQYFDRTKKALEHTFFGEGIVAHVSMGDPTCADLRKVVAEAAGKVISEKGSDIDVNVNEGGTYVNMEGPAFSTRAESQTYQKLGFDIIGMTSLGEARLCREAEICYQTMAFVTDYDSWHEDEEAVTSDAVVQHLMANTSLAKDVLKEMIETMSPDKNCGCGDSLAHSLFTPKEAMPKKTVNKLGPLIAKYV